MDRRSIIVLLAATGTSLRTATPRAAERVARIGLLGPRDRSDAAPYTGALVQGLRDLGWTPGANLIMEERFAEGHAERLARLAADLLRLNVEVIVAATTSAALAARNETGSVPIVFAAVGDPVKIGLVQSLARPGGNVTGTAYSVGSETIGKELELLKEAVPSARRIAVLLNPNNPSHREARALLDVTAQSMGVEARFHEAAGPSEFDRTFAAMQRNRADALLVVVDSFLGLHRKRLAELAAKYRLPAMYGLREYAEAGGLMSYGPDVRDSFRRCAAYVDKILKGARPADLPVEQPTKFELVINLATAKSLDLAIPQSLRFRADEVIQ